MTNESLNLKPCPFCGESKIMIHHNGIGGSETPEDSYNVTCLYPDCHGTIFALGHHQFKTKSEAVEAWNRRV